MVAAGFGKVTSAFRTVAHNRDVGGVPNSYHLLGRAIDVARRRGVTHQMIDAALKEAGYTLVESLDERDHSHFAFAATPPRLHRQNISVEIVSPTPSSIPSRPRVLADDHGILIATPQR